MVDFTSMLLVTPVTHFMLVIGVPGNPKIHLLEARQYDHKANKTNTNSPNLMGLTCTLWFWISAISRRRLPMGW